MASGRPALSERERARVRDQTRLRARRVDAEALLDLASGLLCVTDATGTVRWANRALAEAVGAGVPGPAGTPFTELVHPDDADAAAALLSGRGPSRGGTPTVLRLRRDGGGWRRLAWSARVDAARQRAYLAAPDVGAEETEPLVDDSIARLGAIMRHSPSLVFVKDLHSRYLVVNDEFARATGVAVDDAVGRTTDQCWPHDAGALRRRERALLAGGTSTAAVERVHTRNGVRDHMVSRFLLRDEGGVPYAIAGIATDVTERLNVERALAERDKLLDSVITASPDMITLIDGTGRIHQISEARSAMFGYPADVFTGGQLFDFVHPEDRDDVASLFVRMATGAVPDLHLRYRVRHAEGYWVTVDSLARAVLDAEGHFAGAVVVSRDISEVLEAEERLEASRQAVEQASRAKSDFLSRMSHELRTPLNSILGFAQLLEMDELPVAQADAVAHVLRAGRHLLDLIDEVLDIARIESGHLELSPVPVPMAEIVGEAVQLIRPAAARADVTVRSTVEPRRDLVVVADRQRLMQVLLNVLSNAVKYNRPGGSVELTCERTGHGLLCLEVADTGRGIRPEDLDRVFVAFDRLGVEQYGIEGTGVGLALSHHLCERMGGHLGVESVPGVGSTFSIALPAAVHPPAPGPPPSGRGARWGAVGTVPTAPGAARAEAGTARRGGPDHDGPTPSGSLPLSGPDPGAPPSFRVLLVEDNLATLDLVERVLSRRPATEVLAA
ncbi:MAG TPA: PAS domain S-box protein, partial [Acidimicrobiales bacterium]|nr:PAS domain S-box protein [Acidimicrobiales bacterium]